MKKSSFKSDLDREKSLASFLDNLYSNHLKQYSFSREHNISEQHKGVDVIFTRLKTEERFFVDEKAQLDYVNEDLPTFAFELFYEKKKIKKQGWLFDPNKKTQFYALVTAIYSDAPQIFTSCKITLVNRRLLLAHLKGLGLREDDFPIPEKHGKKAIEQLHPKKEGYLFYSRNNKAEKPLNLILKLDYLLDIGVAKRLV